MITKKNLIPSQKTQSDSGDEETTKRMREHISDEQDVITPDDIKNAKITGLENVSETDNKIVTGTDEKEEIENLEEKHIKDNTDNDIDTAWNILESE